jgi:hypothetical protein
LPVEIYGKADLAHTPIFYDPVRTVIQNSLVTSRISRLTATATKIGVKAPYGGGVFVPIHKAAFLLGTIIEAAGGWTDLGKSEAA